MESNNKDLSLQKTSKEVMESWDSYMAYVERSNNRGPSAPFSPFVFYNEPGDLFEVYWNKESHYSKWINKDITVFISNETGKVVGCQIWNASSKLSRFVDCGECVYETLGADAVTKDMGVCASHMNGREDQIHKMYVEEIKELRAKLKEKK